MQTWAKRGLRTALVTGGLLMLGTGIASADEDVDPDRPASPLDVGVHVPIHLDNNALGTPLGQQNLPAVDRTVAVSPDDLVDRVPVVNRVAPTAVGRTHSATVTITDHLVGRTPPATTEVSATADPVADEALGWFTDTTAPVSEVTGTPALPKPTAPRLPEVDSGPGGNSVDGDLVVPVDVSGNAFAVGGRAFVENESHHRYGTGELVVTEGRGGFLAGNAVDLDWAAPVQVNGNAGAVLGRAAADSKSSQQAASTSDVHTDGRDGVLSGNVGAVHGATPVQLSGNAVAGAGSAEAESEATAEAAAGGWVRSSGRDGAGSGNVTGVPVATPVKVNGNGIAGFGVAEVESTAIADARAGDEEYVMWDMPTYLATNGDPALAAGNVVQPAVSGPAMLCGNAGSAGGVADAECLTGSETEAGGNNRTTGRGSVASGSVAHPAIALPVQGFGNAASGSGHAEAVTANYVDATAGGNSYTRGHDGVVSGTTVTGGPSGPVDLFANAFTASGAAEALAYNDAGSTAGGTTGTTGDNSAAGGNMASAPLALPVEGFGNVAGVSGVAEAVGTESKQSTSGGYNDSHDDYGLFASNVVTSPVAGAVQAFGNGAGVVAPTDAKASTDNEVTAGGSSSATGVKGIGSANIGQVPVSAPVQLFGSGASAFGHGDQTALADNDLTAGGDTTSDGRDSLLSGNVANAPVGGAAQAFGESAAVLGLNHAIAASDTETETGGDTETTGTSSLGSGNVVAPQAMPVVRSFAVAASGVGGSNSAVAENENENTTGGDIDTAGDGGLLSGNVADAPAAAAVQPFADAAAVLGSRSFAAGSNESESTVGGTSSTSGPRGSLSGFDASVPAGLRMLVYDVPFDVLAETFTVGRGESDLDLGDGSRPNLPIRFDQATPTGLPSLLPLTRHAVSRDVATPPPARSSARATVPDDNLAGSFSGVLDGVADVMGNVPGLPGQHEVSTASDLVTEVSDAVTVTVPGRSRPLPYPMAGTRSAAHPFAPITGDLFDSLPVDNLELGGLMPADLVPGGLVPGGLVPSNLLGGHRLGDYLAGPGRTNDNQVGDLTGGDLIAADLPIADSLPDMPALDGVDLPFGGTRRDLPGGLGDLPAVGGLAGLPAVGDVGLPLGDARTDPPVGGLGDVPLAGGLSELPVVGGLGLPVGDGRSDPPVPGGLGDLPVAGELTELPVVGDLSLPVGAARTDLPIPGLPDLPIVDNLAVGGMPFGGRRSDLPIDGLPAVDDLGLPIGGFDLPLPGATGRSNPEELAGDLVDGLPELPMGARDLPIDIPGNVNLFEELPAFRSNATDVTTVIPRAEAPTAVLPKLTEAELTRPLPAVPAFGDVPVVQVTSVRNLPIQVPAVDPAVNSGTLTDTRAALANLFTYHPIG